jgi:hypothetical protein
VDDYEIGYTILNEIDQPVAHGTVVIDMTLPPLTPDIQRLVGEHVTRKEREAGRIPHTYRAVMDPGGWRQVKRQPSVQPQSTNTQQGSPGGLSQPEPEGGPMATVQDVQTQQESQNMSQTAAVSDREHNTAVLKRLLADISGVLQRGTETINSLNGRTGTLVGQVADAGEFAVATEQTDRSKQALDETAAVGAAMDQHLGGMSTAVSAAEDAVIAAIGGLRVVDEAEDDLAQAGAGPKSVAPARDGA